MQCNLRRAFAGDEVETCRQQPTVEQGAVEIGQPPYRGHPFGVGSDQVRIRHVDQRVDRRANDRGSGKRDDTPPVAGADCEVVRHRDQQQHRQIAEHLCREILKRVQHGTGHEIVLPH